MRTTLDIPKDLMDELLAILKISKKNRAVRIALEDFIRRKKKERLLHLSGKIAVTDMSARLREAEYGEK